ncbi:MAG: hypothetical protein WCK27_08430, partial [Verrucomicrobiota bacterium]
MKKLLLWLGQRRPFFALRITLIRKSPSTAVLPLIFFRWHSRAKVFIQFSTGRQQNGSGWLTPLGVSGRIKLTHLGSLQTDPP